MRRVMSRTLRPTQAVPSMELTISPAKRVNRCGHSTQHSRHRPIPTNSDPSALQPGSVALTSTKPSSACFRYTPTPHCRGTSRCTVSVAVLATLEELRRRVAGAAVDVELSGGSEVCEASDELIFRARVRGTCAAECDGGAGDARDGDAAASLESDAAEDTVGGGDAINACTPLGGTDWAGALAAMPYIWLMLRWEVRRSTMRRICCAPVPCAILLNDMLSVQAAAWQPFVFTQAETRRHKNEFCDGNLLVTRGSIRSRLVRLLQAFNKHSSHHPEQQLHTLTQPHHHSSSHLSLFASIVEVAELPRAAMAATTSSCSKLAALELLPMAESTWVRRASKLTKKFCPGMW